MQKRRSALVWLSVAGVLWSALAVIFALGMVGGGPNLGLVPVMVGALVSTVVGMDGLVQSRWFDPERHPDAPRRGLYR
jgi:hypothetical protein